MNKVYLEGQNFTGLATNLQLVEGEYENCSFSNCSFLNFNLSAFNFIECEFENCDFSMVKVKGTGFKTVVFKNCKLIGIHFGDCNPFSLSLHFEDCLLNLSSFYKLKLKATQFKRCNLQEVDFAEADLTGSKFDTCDLTGALFENSILDKADFETAFNYSIDPNINRIKKAKFSMAGIMGLLFKHDIEIK
jgi:fluoroquinolone resistance protein